MLIVGPKLPPIRSVVRIVLEIRPGCVVAAPEIPFTKSIPSTGEEVQVLFTLLSTIEWETALSYF